MDRFKISARTAAFCDRETELAFRRQDAAWVWVVTLAGLLALALLGTVLVDDRVFVGPLRDQIWQPISWRLVGAAICLATVLFVYRGREIPERSYWGMTLITATLAACSVGIGELYARLLGREESLLIHPFYLVALLLVPRVPLRFAHANAALLVISALLLHLLLSSESVVRQANLVTLLAAAASLGLIANYRANRGRRQLYGLRESERAMTTELTQEVETRRKIEAELREHESNLSELVEERSRKLAVSERRFRLLAENSTDAIWTMGLDGKLSYISPSIETVTGFSPAEQCELTLADQLDEESTTRVTEQLARELALPRKERTQKQTVLVSLLHKTGPPVPAEITASWIIDHDGVPMGIQGTTRDISERVAGEQRQVALEDQLRQAQKMESVGRLAGGIAHDFNNLLSPILAYAEMVRDDLPRGSSSRADLEEIRRAAEKAAELTQGLLAFSRKQVLDFRTVDLLEVVSGLYKILRRTVREDIKLQLEVARGLYIRADATQLEQILMNLVVNAQDAMSSGGTIRISGRRMTQHAADAAFRKAHPNASYPCVLLRFEDDGEGMEKEALARAFEPFFSTKEVGKGTGLGLATVYGIVVQHEAQIWAFSTPGSGATFDIAFPPAARPARSDQAVDRQLPTGEETILVVEDDDGVRQLVHKALGRLGYRVLQAPDAKVCRELVARHGDEIALLLTDVVMPETHGVELYQEIARELPGLKVLYMSGYSEDVIDVKDLLQKPLTIAALAERVREAIDR